MNSTDPIKVRTPVTREHIEAAREMGFLPVRDADGQIYFIERDHYAEQVAAGQLSNIALH